MVDVVFSDRFKKDFKRLEASTKTRVIRQIKKLKSDAGKPLRFSRKGTRELYVPPFRLSYKYHMNTVYLLAFYHKDRQ